MRVNIINKCAKSPGKCQRCGVPIPKGAPYKWAKGRYTSKKIRCKNCHFRPSDLTGSDKLSALYATREAVEDVLEGAFTYEEIVEAKDKCGSDAREVGQEYQDSADNLDGKLNAEELEEKAQQCEQWADEVEGVEVKELEEVPNESEEEKEARLEKWREQIRDEMQSALDGLEL